MVELLKALCNLDGVSGNESAVREFILKEISPYADTTVDPIGNIIAFKNGKKAAKCKLMRDAHMDEVGLIITSITSDGFLKFTTVGGIITSSLMNQRVKIGDIYGVIGCKPVHLLIGDEAKKVPDVNTLYIDIGASSKLEAEEKVSIGDYAAFDSEFTFLSDTVIKAKAIDDRVGVAILIALLKEESEYDFYATFTVGEEVGLRGAKTATFAVNPDAAICIEATTAADISGVSDENKVCSLGSGPAVSFMDRATVYDRKLYKTAISSDIKCQTKAAVTGGNNSGSIHLSGSGVATLALSRPCR